MFNQAILLPENRVHLWYFKTDHFLDSGLQVASTYLEAQDWERYHRYLCPKKRQQFLTSRVLLKQLLGRYVRKPVEEIILKYSHQQKPFLKENVQFNISHSGIEFK